MVFFVCDGEEGARNEKKKRGRRRELFSSSSRSHQLRANKEQSGTLDHARTHTQQRARTRSRHAHTHASAQRNTHTARAPHHHQSTATTPNRKPPLFSTPALSHAAATEARARTHDTRVCAAHLAGAAPSLARAALL